MHPSMRPSRGDGSAKIVGMKVGKLIFVLSRNLGPNVDSGQCESKTESRVAKRKGNIPHKKKF